MKSAQYMTTKKLKSSRMVRVTLCSGHAFRGKTGAVEMLGLPSMAA